MSLDRAEMVAILEEIARNSSNQSARIQAIRALQELDDDEPKTDAFSQLDGVIPLRRKAA